MLFSSMFFLWVFLPITLILYWIMPNIRLKNAVLLISSMIFYAWGEPKYVLLMLLVVLVNYTGAMAINYYANQPFTQKILLIITILLNLISLGYFKYFNFLIQIIDRIASTEIIAFRDIALPLGISFYTFQAMSYTIDVYRKEVSAQKNVFKLYLYVSLFPQLVAGPIVRYKDVANEIDVRNSHSSQIAYGLKRFCYGLSKKVIVSNVVASYVLTINNAGISSLSSGALWLGAILYSLQIYFDFSGYSDMAIGLGRVFGFKFNENFNYPYISSSIQEFWRRWHISLSQWFKEYLYIPLGGNRKGLMRTYINLIIVFFVTGLWHGASFAFIFWGLWHGLFMLIERLFLSKMLAKNPIKILNHLYTLLVVLIGWVFFNLASFRQGLSYCIRMLSFKSGEFSASDFISLELIVIMIIGILMSGIVQMIFPKFKKQLFNENQISKCEIILCICLISICFIKLASNTYNPFIYFRF